MILTRLSGYSTLCREEQHPFCTPTFNHHPASSLSSPYALFSLVFSSIIVCGTVRKVLKSTDNFHGTGHVIGGFFVPLGFLVSNMYWILDTLEGHQVPIGSFASLRNVLGKYAFGGYASLAFFIWVSDCTTMSVRTLETDADQIETLIRDPSKPRSKKPLLVQGLDHPLGSSLFCAWTLLLVVLGMVQKPMGGTMLNLGFLSGVLGLEMFDLRVREWNKDVQVKADENAVKERIPVPPIPLSFIFLYTLLFHLLAQRTFFSTGHQRALASIQYEIGFIGMEKVNWIVSPLLILLNTFGGHVLFSFGLVLIAFWRRPWQDIRMKDVYHVAVCHLVISLLGLCVTTALAGHFRRHLMVWRVFAPKVIFNGVEVGVAWIALGVALVCTWRGVQTWTWMLDRLVARG